MRDVVVLAAFCLWAVYALNRPFAGLLLYNWISIMNPHRLGWGATANLPLALVAAAVTFVGLLRNPAEARLPRERSMRLLLAFWAFITLTTTFSFYPDTAWETWKDVSKTLLMAILAASLLTSKERVRTFLLALVAFVGFYGVKGAVFAAATGGVHRIWGPPNSALSDNNAVGLALVMIAPFCFFLAGTLPKRWHSLALLFTGVSTVVSAALTYSRGAFVGLLALGMFSFLFAKRKLLIAVALVGVVTAGLTLLPPNWFDRMSTIETHEEDRSAQMRFNSWHMSFNLAKANLLGGGFDCFTMEQYHRYAPDPELGRTMQGVGSTAHSIYFEVMATQGLLGFALYLACIGLLVSTLWKIGRRARGLSDGKWVESYSRAFVVSILSFMICASFQSKAFFDLFWLIFVAAIGFTAVARTVVAVEQPARSPIEGLAPGVARAATGSGAR